MPLERVFLPDTRAINTFNYSLLDLRSHSIDIEKLLPASCKLMCYQSSDVCRVFLHVLHRLFSCFFRRRSLHPSIIYPLSIYRLSIIYPSIIYPSIIYHLSITYQSSVYHLSIIHSSIIYPSSIYHLSIIYPSIHHLSIIYPSSLYHPSII